MRLNRPRIPPVGDSELTAEQIDTLAPAREHGMDADNVIRTLINNPGLAQASLAWGGYILHGTTIAPREREILILRTGWRCQADYEWAHHRQKGLAAGLKEEEIEAIKSAIGDYPWSERDSTLLQVADQLIDNYFISDSTWLALGKYYEKESCMDVVFTVGQYVSICMALNSFGVQLEDGMSGQE